MGSRKYYAVFSNRGEVSVYSQYGQPTLHAFYTKAERDSWVEEMDCFDGNINNRAWSITSKVAYEAYSHVVDGVRILNVVIGA